MMIECLNVFDHAIIRFEQSYFLEPILNIVSLKKNASIIDN